MPLFARLRHLLFDISAARRNRLEVEDILVVALAQSHTDADFPEVLHAVLVEWEGGPEQGRSRWETFLRFMNQYRRPSDRPGDWHRRARHLIEDLPHIYGESSADKTE